MITTLVILAFTLIGQNVVYTWFIGVQCSCGVHNAYRFTSRRGISILNPNNRMWRRWSPGPLPNGSLFRSVEPFSTQCHAVCRASSAVLAKCLGLLMNYMCQTLLTCILLNCRSELISFTIMLTLYRLRISDFLSSGILPLLPSLVDIMLSVCKNHLNHWSNNRNRFAYYTKFEMNEKVNSV